MRTFFKISKEGFSKHKGFHENYEKIRPALAEVTGLQPQLVWWLFLRDSGAEWSSFSSLRHWKIYVMKLQKKIVIRSLFKTCSNTRLLAFNVQIVHQLKKPKPRCYFLIFNSVTPRFHLPKTNSQIFTSRSVNLNRDWQDPSAEGLDYSGGRKKKVNKTDKTTMKIPGSHPSFVTGISRVLVSIPSPQLFHHTLPAWPTPGLVLHAWGGAFERRCAGVAMMQSAYRRAYRQGRYPVTSPAPSAAPGWVRGQSGDQRVAAFWQIVTMSSQVRWPFIQIRGGSARLADGAAIRALRWQKKKKDCAKNILGLQQQQLLTLRVEWRQIESWLTVEKKDARMENWTNQTLRGFTVQ